MIQESEKYLQEVYLRLSGISNQDREDILLEINNHIHEGLEKGETVEKILTRLGPPAKLAQAYAFSCSGEDQKLKPSDIINGFSFYGFTGLSGIIVIPSLIILALTFISIAFIIPGTAVSNLFGFTHTPMFVWGEASIPAGILQLVLSIATGAVFTFLAYVCWRGLAKYIKTVSNKYRKLKLGK